MSEDLVKRLEEIDNLPSLPELLLRILELCERENVEIRALARLIETDAALSAKIVGIVNSMSYGLPNRVTALEPSIVLLGIDAIKSIAVCASLTDVFTTRSPSSGSAAGLELRRVWRHSLECGLLARSLARATGYRNPDEAFLAGLLHDVGKHVYLSLYPREYPACLERARSNPDLLLAEEARLGGLHSEVGAWLVRRWHLPATIADATAYHHEPTYRVLDASLLVRIVHGANFLTSRASEREQYPHDRVATLLGIPAARVADAAAHATRELAETAHSLGTDLGGTEPTPQEMEERHGRLEREVRNVSMLLASLWGVTRSPDEATAIETIFRALSNLFRIDSALYFSYSDPAGALICRGSSRKTPAEVLEGLVLNRAHSKSIVAQASRTATIRYADGTEQPGARRAIVDAEIGGLLGSQSYVCYPLSARGEAVGVLVASSGNGGLETLRKRERAIALLAAEAALALQADRLRERELERVRTERIAAAQLLADRVAHEVRNPLATIKNTVALLSRETGEGEPSVRTRDALSAIADEVDRVSRLLGGLSRLSSPIAPELVELDLGATLETFQSVLQSIAVGPAVSVTTHIARDLPKVRSNADALKQILTNLVKNAVEAMPDGGTVVVRAEREPVEGSPRARIVVEDTGPGIAERLKGRLFEPFLTTKGAGHRGLGLAIVYTLARQLGGDIRHEEPVSDTDRTRGTRFILTLPGAHGPWT
jgi:putative nucleotidyltransferase with HDIG domain